MDRGGYWSEVGTRRLGRRQALASAGLGLAGAALLLACGSHSTVEKTGLVTQPVETTKQAKRDGILKDRHFADPPSLNPSTGGNNPSNYVFTMVYDSLLQFKPGFMKPSEGEIVPILAESWEWSPDGLQVTLKLRDGVKFHNKQPVNGRKLDIDDVLLTWDRFTRLSSLRSTVVNANNPQAPVLSFKATDAKTIVIKLKEPLVDVLGYFSVNRASGGLAIAPKEMDTTFDTRSDMIGTGPFVLTEYKPSISFTFKRNPDYWTDYALVDRIDMPIIPEYASALAQFKAGNIYSMGSAPITLDDVLPVKREEPRILVYPSDFGNPQSRILAFGWLPDGKSPFLDERVRQAISMAWDRDLYLEAMFNIRQLGSEGLPVQTRWNTALAGTEEGWWLDPKGKEFGPNAKYFHHDLAEAKKLLAASGYPNGIQNVTSNYVMGPELPSDRHATILDGMTSELGIKSNVHGIDYLKEYQPIFRDGHGQFEGWVYTTNAGAGATAGSITALAAEYWAKGGANTFRGFSTTGKNDQSGDPEIDLLVEKARLERDTEKRKSLAYDIQRNLAKHQYALPSPGLATGFTVAWPCIGNFRVNQGVWNNYHLWVDDTKPPLKKA